MVQYCHPGGRVAAIRDPGATRATRIHILVYILASERNGTLYVGVTSDLIGRATEHRDGMVPGFTKRHNIKLLIYFEEHGEIDEAIRREKRIKRLRRAWKLELIESRNREWRDLWPDLTR